MKKTWKEYLYGLAHWIPIILSILILGCIVLWFLLAIWFKPLYGLLGKGIVYVVYTAVVLVTLLFPFCVVIRGYNKETFLLNKVRHLLLAESCTSGSMVFMLLGIVVIIFFEEIEKMSGTVSGLIAGSLSIALMTISDIISKHFKKKVVQIGKKKE